MTGLPHTPPAVEMALARLEGVESFGQCLARHGLVLRRGENATLQVNVGRLCNLSCRHCHLEAGPTAPEVMDRETMAAVLAFARRNAFASIDITGGAPELAPGIEELVEGACGAAPEVMFRTNLLALAERGREGLFELLRERQVTLVASLPSANPSQMEAQRGAGVFGPAVAMLQKLNAAGYGVAGSPLKLHLVANPAGAFLPTPQCQAEKKFRQDLARKFGVTFTSLFTFANAPLGRFLKWLAASGNLADYMTRLAAAFNPATVEGLMCRSLLSVSWDGVLYDCDFHQAAGLPLSGAPRHVAACAELPPPGSPIMTGDHCYACTAGAGFT